jgi:peptidoglycan/LPS O-acetylase OafA/YrhL
VEPPAPPKPERLAFIDGLRGLALLMVLTYHAWVHPVRVPIRLPFLGLDVTAPVHFGYLGVHLFLVLSGFCLTYPLAQGPLRVDLARFARRRAWRILPPYYVALALFIVWRVVLDYTPSGGNILTHVLMIHNLWPQWMGSINGPFWSLALECQLYALFPLLIGCFRRWGVRRTLLATLALTLTYRTWVWCVHDFQDNTFPGLPDIWCYFLPGRMFEFVLGMVAAVVLTRPDPLPSVRHARRYLMGIAGFGALGLASSTQWSPYAPVTDVLWGLAFFSLIMYVGTRNALGFPLLAGRPLVWLGGISYSVYLIHDPLMQQAAKIVRSLGLPPLVTWLGFEFVAVPVCIGLAWLFYRYVESRFLGPCPGFSWPAAFRRRFQGRFSARWKRRMR